MVLTANQKLGRAVNNVKGQLKNGMTRRTNPRTLIPSEIASLKSKLMLLGNSSGAHKRTAARGHGSGGGCWQGDRGWRQDQTGTDPAGPRQLGGAAAARGPEYRNGTQCHPGYAGADSKLLIKGDP